MPHRVKPRGEVVDLQVSHSQHCHLALNYAQLHTMRTGCTETQHPSTDDALCGHTRHTIAVTGNNIDLSHNTLAAKGTLGAERLIGSQKAQKYGKRLEHAMVLAWHKGNICSVRELQD